MERWREERNKDGRSCLRGRATHSNHLTPRGNKRKKGRKLRSRAEGGRLACGGCHERTATRNPGGHLRGKQFLLIQRSHPRGGAKAWWTRAPGLLSFSIFPLYPSIPSPLPFYKERSRVEILSLSFSRLVEKSSSSSSFSSCFSPFSRKEYASRGTWAEAHDAPPHAGGQYLPAIKK